ncbi:MEDIATOR OF ABA-REGULATED DORMANCY 1 [Hibiscus trionum]|uniref:MEDIATOR OF ABA-REGULATED DORMANCY 1 n=1 Tax=Hibiscus trionum TaxID=183268 RepID=A0A9W7MKR0_HIBTR|nr:MEDIATOR OF ABA-REGULATED DORMANCY 1 [Hibiscus trionum]
MLRDKFRAVTSKQALMAESVKSPTSILDNKPLFFPVGYNPFCFHSNQPKSPKRLEPKGIGLAIVDKNNSCLETSNKVVFGTKLRVEIPSKDSCPRGRGCVPITEMELSEDYTCVKSHGANPKTTHIYDNCVVKSCCSGLEEAECGGKSDDFLSFCHTCRKNLEQKIDIYIYRGERGFCSQECRYQEMILHGQENY